MFEQGRELSEKKVLGEEKERGRKTIEQKYRQRMEERGRNENTGIFEPLVTISGGEHSNASALSFQIQMLLTGSPLYMS